MEAFCVAAPALKSNRLGLSVVAWGLFAYNPSTIERTFTVPIEYRNVPAGLVLAEKTPAETHVTLSGNRTRVSAAGFRATLTISIDLAGSSAGTRSVKVEDVQLSKPGNLEVGSIEHRVIEVELHQRPTRNRVGQK